MNEGVGANAPNDESPEAATPRPSTNGSSTETVDQTRASVNPNLEAALSLLFQPGDVVELRAPGSRRHGTISGYFTDFGRLAEACRGFSGTVPGVYVTLNPVV